VLKWTLLVRTSRVTDGDAAPSKTEKSDGVTSFNGGSNAVERTDDTRQSLVDLRLVRGQTGARRAVEIAAAGGHNLLLTGPPGSGKTLLAHCLHDILPDLNVEERLAVSRIYSVAGQLPRGGLVNRRPFRAPHHTASRPSIVGGGNGVPRPGEVSMAHTGVLFLDEFPEFDRGAREVLRQPLESGEVIIARAHGAVTFPARFQLVAAMNPCPCGYHGVREGPKRCECTLAAVERYRLRVSGPLRDRFDLEVYCPPVKHQLLLDEATAESSADVRERVVAARAMQTERFADTPFHSNSEMRGKYLEPLCRLDGATRRLVERAMDKGGLTARGFHRAVRVARTIADLQGVADMQKQHFAEALLFRGCK
jgi:magnesium chelatase family protein